MSNRFPVSAIIILSLCGFVRADEVDDFIQLEMRRQKVPGVAVAVVKDGQVVRSGAYGMANLELKQPVKTDTVFQIQSVTKQFAAMAVMMMVESGKVDLESPIGRYLEGTPAAWEKITVRNLLAQTSGLKDFINDPTTNLRIDTTDEQVMRSMAERPLNFSPGQAWEYSNSNYHLLGMIIRKVSGQWYGDFLADRIFKPLDMSQTSVVRDNEPVPGMATGYAIDNGTVQQANSLPPAILGYAGGGIRSTVLDLAKWDAALYTEKLVKRATLEQIWSPARLSNGTTHAYGFGWELGEVNGHRVVWHGGNWTGYSAQIDRFVNDRLTVIVLANLAGTPTMKISRRVAGEYIPELKPRVYSPIADEEPKITQRLEDVCRRIGEGKLTEADFVPATWSFVAPLKEQMQRDFTSLGPLQKLILVERSGENAERSYRYRAQFQKTSFILRFILADDDRIIGMTPEQVNQ
jgi:CubicO group peptidase (beta-lactamase class C family)